MSEQPETTPLTFESLQAALVEARDVYYSRVDPEASAQTHRVSEEALFMDLGPTGRRMVETRAPTGALELTCTCGWITTVPVDQADAVITEHERATP